jgi:hypothetical protein
METRSGPGIYRPRHPERTAFYRLVSEHLDRYVGKYEERFEPREGPLRRVVPRAAEETGEGTVRVQTPVDPRTGKLTQSATLQTVVT